MPYCPLVVSWAWRQAVCHPLEALEVDTENKEIVLNIAREKLEQAHGFDKDNWPMVTDREWLAEIHAYYGYPPYWQ